MTPLFQDPLLEGPGSVQHQELSSVAGGRESAAGRMLREPRGPAANQNPLGELGIAEA